MMRAVGVALLFLSMGAALAGPAAAHDRRVTAGEVRLDGDRIQVRYRVRRVDVTSLGPDAAQCAATTSRTRQRNAIWRGRACRSEAMWRVPSPTH